MVYVTEEVFATNISKSTAQVPETTSKLGWWLQYRRVWRASAIWRKHLESFGLQIKMFEKPHNNCIQDPVSTLHSQDNGCSCSSKPNCSSGWWPGNPELATVSTDFISCWWIKARRLDFIKTNRNITSKQVHKSLKQDGTDAWNISLQILLRVKSLNNLTNKSIHYGASKVQLISQFRQLTYATNIIKVADNPTKLRLSDSSGSPWKTTIKTGKSVRRSQRTQQKTREPYHTSDRFLDEAKRLDSKE